MCYTLGVKLRKLIIFEGIMIMTIEAKNIEDMIKICAGLVKEGCTFDCTYNGDVWIIRLTGGY